MQKKMSPQFEIQTTYNTHIWGQISERPALLEQVICVNPIKDNNPNKSLNL